MGIATLNRWRKRRKQQAEAEKPVPSPQEPAREEKPQQKPYKR
jgi:hypothetical protein